MIPSVIALSAVILPHVMITVYYFNMLLLLFTSRIMNDDVMIMHGVRKRSCPKRPNAPYYVIPISVPRRQLPSFLARRNQHKTGRKKSKQGTRFTPVSYLYLHLSFFISIAKLHYTTPPTMANVLKRSALKLGMIPADGIGKEVLPVRSSSAPLVTIFSLPHPSCINDGS